MNNLIQNLREKMQRRRVVKGLAKIRRTSMTPDGQHVDALFYTEIALAAQTSYPDLTAEELFGFSEADYLEAARLLRESLYE